MTERRGIPLFFIISWNQLSLSRAGIQAQENIFPGKIKGQFLNIPRGTSFRCPEQKFKLRKTYSLGKSRGDVKTYPRIAAGYPVGFWPR